MGYIQELLLGRLFTRLIFIRILSKETLCICKLANLKLNDNFEIISNKVTGMPERFQFTELRLTKNDRNRIFFFIYLTIETQPF